jgi:hypothetical protein
MKGAESYVNDQWHSSGLADLPQGPEAHSITLKFIIPRDEQTTGLINHVSEAAQKRLVDSYPGREVTAKPVAGSVVGDGSGDGVDLVFDVAAGE